MAHKVEELPVFSHAQEFSIAVTEILTRSTLRRNSQIYEQIAEANESILANIDEGFVQESDDGFAKYLYYSKGSVAEVMRRLRRAAAKGHVPAAGVAKLDVKAEERSPASRTAAASAPHSFVTTDGTRCAIRRFAIRDA
jgi:four helix bundle protein